MSPDRFRRIEELYHAAREGTPEQREALLAHVDPELRREVELLLTDPKGDEFLDRPAVQNAPDLLEDATVTQLAEGTTLGPYRIESKLGEGGMGEVFRAVDTRLGRTVAIKTTREQFTSRFEREGRAIASLNHPNICTLHDVGPNYLVMELVEGDTISARLRNGPLPFRTALLYASQIAAALSEAHAKGIVHRDLKPGNIMIAKSGVKVLDFGLARLAQDQSVTGSHMVIGTPAYMSPEQREGKTADARSDIYSLGCVLYEMFAGGRVSGPRKRLPSRKLEAIVNRCLEEDPARRWQTVAELERELADVTAGGKGGKLGLLVPAGLLMLMAASAHLYSHRTPKLTDKDTIVLADFANNTGDPIFNGTLRQVLAIQLEQSPFLKIMDDQQMQAVLRQMDHPPNEPIGAQAAHDLCVRAGATATIDGAIASLGKSYVLTFQAQTCQAGATLVREQVQAEDKEHVVTAVGTIAATLRRKLGESLASIQKMDRPLEPATTPSLEALRSYTEGHSQMGQSRTFAAIESFKRAIAIDPNFAQAYYILGVAFENAGDMAQAREYAKKAFQLADRVTQFERDQIVPFYYRATGEADKEIDAWQVSISHYPQRWEFHNQLSVVDIDLGKFEEGLAEGIESARWQNIEPPFRRQLDAYICLDRLPEAKLVAQKVRALGIDKARIHQRFLEMAYLENDPAAIEREIQWFAGKSDEYISLGLQAADRNVHGQRRASHRLFQRAAETARRHELESVAAEFEDADARADALLDNCQPVRHLGRPALALAVCGDVARAEKLAAEKTKQFPNGTIWNEVQLPEIRAAIALKRDPAESVRLLAPATPYERAYLSSIYLRGLAYLAQHKGSEAAAEFQKIVDHKGANWASDWRYPYWAQFYSLSYLGVARAYALQDDPVKAKKAFEDFLALWKDADQDIPILREARTEYARLR